jgi:hypothetical protein
MKMGNIRSLSLNDIGAFASLGACLLHVRLGQGNSGNAGSPLMAPPEA